MVALFGKAVGGLKGFLVLTLVDILTDRVLKPAFNYMIKKGMITIDKIKVKAAVRRLRNAEDRDDRRDAADKLP